MMDYVHSPPEAVGNVTVEDPFTWNEDVLLFVLNNLTGTLMVGRELTALAIHELMQKMIA